SVRTAHGILVSRWLCCSSGYLCIPATACPQYQIWVLLRRLQTLVSRPAVFRAAGQFLPAAPGRAPTNRQDLSFTYKRPMAAIRIGVRFQSALLGASGHGVIAPERGIISKPSRELL